jgi:cell division protein FtsA
MPPPLEPPIEGAPPPPRVDPAVLAVAAGLLVYPQAAHLEHFEPRRTRRLMTGTGGYMNRVGQWLRESF